MTDATAAPSALSLYMAWRASLVPADQVRLDYLITDGLPLIANVLKEYTDPEVRKTPIVGGVADSIYDNIVDQAVADAMVVLVPKAPTT